MQCFYFLGIGGTAMGAVAGALAHSGKRVTGSDANVYPPMSDFLRESGIRYFEGFAGQNLEDTAPDVLVVGNATGRGNPEVEYALDKRLEMLSLPELVRKHLIADANSIVVTGTHGKTSTASLVAWLLEDAGLQPGFLIGGIPGNFTCGCRPPGNAGQQWFVSEGDEYDSAFFDKRSKFVHYRPDIAILNNIEFDHADIFTSLDDVKRSFRHFIRLVPQRGLLLASADCPNVADVLDERYCELQTFGLAAHAHWRIDGIRHSAGGAEFALIRDGENLGSFALPLVGEHNCKNAAAAIATAMRAGVHPDAIRAGLKKFRLPKRRMEVLGEWRGCTLIDDFAHHPTAIAATLAAARQAWPHRRILACFEPRSNTTTRNIFQEEFSRAFEGADLVLIGAVNRPERYAAAERLDTRRLQDELEQQGKVVRVITAEEGRTPDWGAYVLEFLKNHARPDDIILLLSNGNFGGLRQALLHEIETGNT